MGNRGGVEVVCGWYSRLDVRIFVLIWVGLFVWLRDARNVGFLVFFDVSMFGW